MSEFSVGLWVGIFVSIAVGWAFRFYDWARETLFSFLPVWLNSGGQGSRSVELSGIAG
jgi:hypothetical protein